MNIIRAPLRISFGGGGTDLPAYYERFGGMVVSAAITRYAYALVEPLEATGLLGAREVRLTSADLRAQERWPVANPPQADGPLRLPRAAVASFLATIRDRTDLAASGLELRTASDALPGTGLGGSSAMAVAILQALATYAGQPMGATDLAQAACALEIERLGAPIGKQDQYASAFGGLNTIEFTRSTTRVTPLRLSPVALEALHDRLLLFATGVSRDAGSILAGQRRDIQTREDVVDSLHSIKALASQMRLALETGRLDDFGALLDEAWQAKRGLSKAVTSADIDTWYAAAREAGALGGKITGAGGGGHLLLYARPGTQAAVRQAMQAFGLRETPFAFDLDGPRQLAHPPADWSNRFAQVVDIPAYGGESAPVGGETEGITGR